jgi:hypothetical protein
MPCWSAVPTAAGPGRPALEVALGAAGLGDIGDVEVLAPWSVARVHLASGEPETVVVKWLREPSGQRPADAAQLDTERAALGFVAQRCPGVAPRLLGADAAGGLLVLEDLAPRRSLLELIVEDDPGWAAGLARFARTLGQLHAATVGAADAYYRRRRALGPVDPDRELVRFGEPRPDLAELSDRLDAPVDQRTAADLGAVGAELGAPGPFLAFSNGDSGANNFFVEEESGRIIDFEFAGYRHCLSDVCCLYVPGPQWLTVGDPAADGTEDAYRALLGAAVPEADDERSFGRGVSASALTWALLRLGRLALLEERGPGHESRTQMVATLDAAARTAERFGCFPALRGWVRRVEQRLRDRWPDADVDLGALPPYSRRGERPRPGRVGSPL